MKIIKRGTPPEEITNRKTCTKCHSELEYTRADIRSSPDPREQGWAFVKCPVCGNLITHI